MQLIRYLPIIFDLLKKGNEAKDILTNLGKSSTKLKDLASLSLTGASASETLQQLFTNTEKDKEKYPQELFNTKFGDYLNSIEAKNKKDYKKAVKTIAGLGLAAYGISKLGRKYPVPDIEIEEYEEPIPYTYYAPRRIGQEKPKGLPAPEEPRRAAEGETIIPPTTPYQRAQAMQRAAAEGDIETLNELRRGKKQNIRSSKKQQFQSSGTAQAKGPDDIDVVNPMDPSTFRKKTPLDLLKEEPLGLPAPQEQRGVSKGEVITTPRSRRDIALQKQRAALSGDEEELEELRKLQPQMRRGSQPRFSPETSLSIDPNSLERQPIAVSRQPTAQLPMKDTSVQFRPGQETLPNVTKNRPVLFDTDIYKSRKGNSNAILQVIKQGFSNKQIISLARQIAGSENRPGRPKKADYINQFEEETGKKFTDEIEDLRRYFESGGEIPNRPDSEPPKPTQLYTSKQDKEIQDAGLKPKLKPIRRKQEMGDFMKQVRESARPTESLTAPIDRKTLMDSAFSLLNRFGET